MTFRIFIKSLGLALRTGKRFLFFVIIYAILIWLTAYMLDGMIARGENIAVVLVLVGGVAVMALVYGFLISNYRRVQVATLRCLGWTSSDIKWLFIGELVLVIVVAAFIDLEVIVHYLGIGYYLKLSPTIFTSEAFAITFAVVLGVQFLGVLVAYNKMLKVRPMEALRKA